MSGEVYTAKKERENCSTHRGSSFFGRCIHYTLSHNRITRNFSVGSGELVALILVLALRVLLLLDARAAVTAPGAAIPAVVVALDLVAHDLHVRVDLRGDPVDAGLREGDVCAVRGEVRGAARRTLEPAACDHDGDGAFLEAA